MLIPKMLSTKTYSYNIPLLKIRLVATDLAIRAISKLSITITITIVACR